MLELELQVHRDIHNLAEAGTEQVIAGHESVKTWKTCDFPKKPRQLTHEHVSTGGKQNSHHFPEVISQMNQDDCDVWKIRPADKRREHSVGSTATGKPA